MSAYLKTLVGFLFISLLSSVAFASDSEFYGLKTTSLRGKNLLMKALKGKGLEVVGFPSNDFGAQELGTEKEIAKFCKFNYGVSFPK